MRRMTLYVWNNSGVRHQLLGRREFFTDNTEYRQSRDDHLSVFQETTVTPRLRNRLAQQPGDRFVHLRPITIEPELQSAARCIGERAVRVQDIFQTQIPERCAPRSRPT